MPTFKMFQIQRPVRRVKVVNCFFCGIAITIVCLLWSMYRTSNAERALWVSVEYDISTRVNLNERTDGRNNAKRSSVAVTHIESADNIEPIPRPPLSSIVHGWNITGDASWLLQFSVIAFPKCGTSTLMHHLRDHPEIHIFPHERCECSNNQHARLMKDLYNGFPASTATHRYIRGIKCPIDLENTILSLPNYKKFFPKTDFLVGVRHPVLW